MVHLATPQVLRRAMAMVARDDDDEGLVRHMRRAQGSHDRPMPMVRTVDGLDFATQPRVRYSDAARSKALELLSVCNSHNGQKKLTMSLLEFITLALERSQCRPCDACVICAGASGMASVVAATLFPRIQLVLYDPDPNTTSLTPPFADKVVYTAPTQSIDMRRRLVVFTGKAGWFDDDVARAIRAIVTRPHVFFVSDVRVKSDENKIIKDMINQQRWVLLTSCDAYMLKFRVPYAWNDDVACSYVTAAT